MERANRNIILLDFGFISLREDRLLFISLEPNKHITYKQVRSLMQTLESISHFEQRPIIIDLRNNTTLSLEARLYLMSERSADIKKSVAFLVSAPVNKWIANLTAKINKPSFRVRTFLTEEAAIAWSKHSFSYQQPGYQHQLSPSQVA